MRSLRQGFRACNVPRWGLRRKRGRKQDEVEAGAKLGWAPSENLTQPDATGSSGADTAQSVGPTMRQGATFPMLAGLWLQEGKIATKYRRLRCNNRRKAGKGLSNSGHF